MADGKGCSDLIALAVHELRTPLSVVAGYVRMLLKSQAGPLTEQQQRLLVETERNCKRLTSLVAELSDLANLERARVTFQRQDVPLFEVLVEVAASVHEAADRGVRLEVRRPSRDGIVVGDRGRLRAALTSLLFVNLREKVDNTVLIADCSIRETDRETAAVIVIAEEKDLSELAEIHPRIWGPFDLWRGGVGLSLPIANHVVEAHGGRLLSPRGQGRAATAVVVPVL